MNAQRKSDTRVVEGGIEPNEERDDLLCPITHIMFCDPVVCESGNTYERTALEQFWTTTSQPRDPVTNVPVDPAILLPNWDKRRAVAAWLDAHPAHVPAGWETRDVAPPKRLSSTATTGRAGCTLHAAARPPAAAKSAVVLAVVLASFLLGLLQPEIPPGWRSSPFQPASHATSSDRRMSKCGQKLVPSNLLIEPMSDGLSAGLIF